jgi:hypothetical protein
MTLTRLLPDGRRENWTAKPVEFQAQVINRCRWMVRETAYNLCQLELVDKGSEHLSRATGLWQDACNMLSMFDPNAREFIASTYQPTTAVFTI